MSSIYSYLDYRTALHDFLKFRKKVNSEFTSSRLAEAIQVQKPYVSRVFKGDAHLNSDQLFLAARFLELSEAESSYLSLLLEWQRSSVTVRRRELREQIRFRQDEARGTEAHLKAEMVDPAVQDMNYAEYYLEPMSQIVHGFLIVPEYARDPRKIATALGLTEKKLEKILQVLAKLGIIEFRSSEKRYHVLREHTHLRRDSVLNQAYQLLFRQAASEHVKRLEDEEKFLFSVTLSADEATRGFIHDEFNAFLKRVEPRVREAPSEGVYQITFDLFRWDARRS
jgi:uncharacterized protein (TIGR02147 family)